MLGVLLPLGPSMVASSQAVTNVLSVSRKCSASRYCCHFCFVFGPLSPHPPPIILRILLSLSSLILALEILSGWLSLFWVFGQCVLGFIIMCMKRPVTDLCEDLISFLNKRRRGVWMLDCWEGVFCKVWSVVKWWNQTGSPCTYLQGWETRCERLETGLALSVVWYRRCKYPDMLFSVDYSLDPSASATPTPTNAPAASPSK